MCHEKNSQIFFISSVALVDTSLNSDSERVVESGYLVFKVRPNCYSELPKSIKTSAFLGFLGVRPNLTFSLRSLPSQNQSIMAVQS